MTKKVGLRRRRKAWVPAIKELATYAAADGSCCTVRVVAEARKGYVIIERAVDAAISSGQRVAIKASSLVPLQPQLF